MIELRGHHLLCSVTFSGRGYSRQFERDFRDILKRMKSGELIRIKSGPDELCQSVKDNPDSHCRECRITKRDELALRDLSQFIGRTLSIGDTISAVELYPEAVKGAFKNQEIRSACFNCPWSSLCNDIAEGDFKHSLLFKRKRDVQQ